MTIRNDKLDARLIELAGDLPKLTQIARAAGVPLSTLHSWLANDDDFARRFYMPLELNRARTNRGIWLRAFAGEPAAVRLVNSWPELEEPKDPGGNQGLLAGQWESESPDEYWDLSNILIGGGELSEDQRQRFEELSEGDPYLWQCYLPEYQRLRERLGELEREELDRFREIDGMIPEFVKR